MLHNIGLGSDFWAIALQAQATKAKVDKRHYVKLRRMALKRRISCMKRVASPGSMHDTGCLGLVHWDDPEGG